ncbi:mucin-17-like [Pantherophis guttatus]|uniref:Mucin-17-like n=1 Tax=Pantherophis guttatus TaxID=94885 RepID=A0A6P9BYA1_PANGU|nr:mucin-17-like [Pantherophis guttatus]
MKTWALFLFFLVPCVEAELCYNGGTFDGTKCICDEDLYYGPQCEFLVQETLNGTVTTSITSSALSGEISTSPTHPAGTRTTPHPTIPISTTSTAFTTTTSQLCYNGGIFEGTKCICDKDLYYGPKCEFLQDEISVTELSVTITVEARVRVTNREFKKSLEDLNSSYSREIHAQFKKQMKVVYGGVPGYRDVEILRMRNGSIIVEHKIISQVLIWNNEEIIPHIMEIITEAVIHALKNIHTEGECIEPSGPELCFVSLPNSILNANYSLNDTCKNISGVKYAEYYYPHITNGTVRCVSRCFSGIQDSINCFNGVCRVSEIGPHCICDNLDMFWYLNNYCQFPIQKIVLGLSLALAVFFVISIILVICLIEAKHKSKAKRKKSRKSWSDNADCDKMGQRNPVFPE